MQRRHIVPLMLALAAGATACLFVTTSRAQQASLVRVDRVISEPLSQTVPVIGRLVARQAGVVAARINGPVEDFMVDVGDRVQHDQVIALLNTDSLEARRDLAAGQLAEKQAELSTIRAEAKLAGQELTRLEALKASAAFSQARFDDVQQNVAIAAAKVRQAQSAVTSAEAELRLYEINVFDAAVRAPYDGVVTQRMTETGAYVRIGDPVIYMIADGSLEIEADVPFERLSGLRPGLKVWAALDDGTRHQATVRAVVPSENPLTRTRAVRLAPLFGVTHKPLANAQSVTVEVPVSAPRQVLTVHKDAVIKRQNQSIVYVVVEDTAELRPVELGQALGARLEVKSGLVEGEMVVIRGNERLQPNTKVRIGGDSS